MTVPTVRRRVSNYALPLVGLIPSVLTTTLPSDVDVLSSAEASAVYKQDLVRDVEREVRVAFDRLRSYSGSLADIAYAEAPDDAPSYHDMYEWEPVDVRVVDDNSIPDLAGSDADVWR